MEELWEAIWDYEEAIQGARTVEATRIEIAVDEIRLEAYKNGFEAGQNWQRTGDPDA